MTDSTKEGDELDRRLRGGDMTALAELLAMHRERLWRMVDFRLDRRLVGRLDPDDVLQESYVAAQQRLDHFRTRQTMPGFVWLRLIVGQTLIDSHRRHLGAQGRDAGRERSLGGFAYPRTTSASLAIHLVDHLTSPSQAAVRAEAYERLERAIAQMEPIDQEILALRHFEELTNNEVAEVLGIQQKAASIRYVRAVRRLRELLKDVPGFSEDAYDG